MSNPWAAWLRDWDTQPFQLATKTGWDAFVNAPARPRPPDLTAAVLRAMNEDARADCSEARHVWNANPPTIRTPQMEHAFELMDQVLASARRDGDRLRGAVVIDAEPGQGKTTIATGYAKRLHRQQYRRYGPRTTDGHQRLPVAYVPLTADVTLKGLNRQILRFYGHPTAQAASTTDLTRAVVDSATSCETKLLIIDEVHFVNLRVRNGLDVSNHFKGLANQIPATFVFVGVGLTEKRFFEEGLIGEERAMAQTSRRTTRCTVPAFSISSDAGMRAWTLMLDRLEAHLHLAAHQPGTLATHARLLHERTQGRIASLTTLIDRACYRAIRDGNEALDADILQQVSVDHAAEQARRSA